MKYPCIESMTRIELEGDFGYYVVRVWRDLQEAERGSSAVENAVEKYMSEKIYFEPCDLFKVLSKVERVSAAEIVDRNGNGTVVYYQWP